MPEAWPSHDGKREKDRQIVGGGEDKEQRRIEEDRRVEKGMTN
jgi:hypothetical protein